jgi:hypothetical protein
MGAGHDLVEDHPLDLAAVGVLDVHEAVNSTPPTSQVGETSVALSSRALPTAAGCAGGGWQGGWVGWRPWAAQTATWVRPRGIHQRNVAERGINKYEQFRVVATRYDCEYILAATIDVASIRI